MFVHLRNGSKLLLSSSRTAEPTPSLPMAALLLQSAAALPLSCAPVVESDQPTVGGGQNRMVDDEVKQRAGGIEQFTNRFDQEMAKIKQVHHAHMATVRHHSPVATHLHPVAWVTP
jgi:hypothetical protein